MTNDEEAMWPFMEIVAMDGESRNARDSMFRGCVWQNMGDRITRFEVHDIEFAVRGKTLLIRPRVEVCDE